MIPSEKSFYEYLSEFYKKSPDRNFLGDKNGWLTVGEVWNQVHSAACALHEYGIEAGDYVALCAERSAKSVILFLALQFTGAVAVLTDPHNKTEEYLQEYGARIPVKAVLAREGSEEHWFYMDQISRVKRKILPDDSSGSSACSLEAGISGTEGWIGTVNSCEPAIIIFTSGSTGESKEVVLSQYNCVNNLVDSEPLGWYCPDDIALGMVPIHHVFGLALLAGALVLRYSLYLPHRTDVPGLLECIEQNGITRVNAVPSLYLAMAQLRDRHDLHTLRTGYIGGAPWTPEQFAQIEEELNMTLIPVYGMSECIGISCASWQDSRKQRIGGVGRIYSMNTVRIVDEEGKDMEAGREGEIWVKGPARMVGYFGDDTGLDRDGFLHTGDLGHLDGEGILHISGRKKDIIIRNGNNLSSRRIEEAVLRIPEIGDSCVVGISDPLLGEVPCVALVRADDGDRMPGGTEAAGGHLVWTAAECGPLVQKRETGRTFTGTELQELFARTALAKNEWPVYGKYMDSIPLTSSGKQDKQTIKGIFENEVKNGGKCNHPHSGDPADPSGSAGVGRIS